ncbi:MAG: type VI secretion system ImpA family N-terminal domain-containing protein, partial [Deltaproteobacteria bacterium]|nr:type VI secretion system ImpA family N-terminal domain-containing protein [Deltaproteobacteria bacterium]
MSLPENLQDLAAKPIPGDNPAGGDSRLGPAFLELQAEVERLNSLSGAEGGVNWEKVRNLGAGILEKESKDLLVAVYFAASLLELEGIPAMKPASLFLSELLKNFWPGLFPPLKRMRARVNALDWWKERNLRLVKKYEGPPADERLIEDARRGLETLDETLKSLAAGLPGLGDVIKNLALIPVVRSTEPEPAAPGATPSAS